MTEYCVFPNAPITEALLDIKVELPSSVDLKQLEGLYERIKDRFPEKTQKTAFTAGFQVTPEGPVALPASTEPIGYLFRSSANNKVVQSRGDGFTFNKLKPYEEWEVFRDEARELWDLYFKLTNPIRITRIALRYINRIEIPLPAELGDYILTVPKIAPGLHSDVGHFFMRVTLPNPETGAIAIINEAVENPTKDNKLPLIFDIDVSREAIFDVNKKEELWAEFEKLRIFKNEIFHKSLTEKAKELFK